VDALKAVDEHTTIRLPLAYEPMFLELATNAKIIEICRRLIAGYVVLNQQNGVINPPNSERYNQRAWHRDLPYQHFVSSRRLRSMRCFASIVTIENGATRFCPRRSSELFPSDRFAEAEAVTITAPAAHSSFWIAWYFTAVAST